MKIALLAPPYLSVPPKAYGGTEKIVSLLADGLVERGHDVTLFATGDSQTRAKLVSVFAEELGNSGLAKGSALMPLLHFRECFRRAGEFELIHNHAQYIPMFLAELVKTPVVHTMHGSFYPGEVPEEKRRILETHKKQPFISISDNQRKGLPDLNFIGTVYNGLDVSEYTYVEKPRGDYLLWVGRITEKKGPGLAIEVAKRVKRQLVIAAAIDPVDVPFFEREVKPWIDGKQVNFVGELTHKTLDGLYGNAYCTLFPISWHEPFGLVMIESMICGTPVVAYNMGSVSEVIEDGKTGYVVDPASGADGFVHAVYEIDRIQRGDCRARVIEKFSKETMVSGYESVYKKILGK
ncbi:hypothetical protein A3D05_00080 [Candidatus Gottesmanbacteria bacterium RIFCSPHIGHO2_02_FULL_40_24]|uniref:Glycosyl transferase n=1 Tax=Candidatus Gottesmanbacteria bacterium RIFCSPHIGHO2_01_FULL_40_15 TaxID=1798376 RepID=A0A1F5Z668_9BACT|nr:MAG: hypothetical protein A2777_00085 [Candidatus Gottesmanbacteria bacterium RIFCSPHIGHO2_01_FULL_40_15]OGG17751.1 MAG: hypothetical protein A3D05_00080 [Candidatus Gottesmanbacteria bacterium RIFCSPHIGHO2_02_FULL_40_24]OGG21864.1 MAG: hypothetical protein A3B48_04010 [Candidatus Gottesmanbacteria bacterium RIFCSPLOWO2_01_FULL_40_10]OGG25495.1 MAG: hypothetical protein A3E42_03550 [Candidatus Gottesmanbacteria bacterium RIFCSPHIGHO2_12_FULL_40_13]OGG33154.1 MAG: hypothetical protein A3I80_0